MLSDLKQSFLDGMIKPQTVVWNSDSELRIRQNLVSFKARLVARENIQHFFAQEGFHDDVFLLADSLPMRDPH